jgi:hypothetical protein
MALVVKDRVRVTTASTGTGTITLGAAVNAFQDFSVIGDGNTTYYAIVDSTAGDWEVGIGTYTASGTTLSRDTILESSSGGTAVSFGAGIKDVFVTYPAEKAVYFDAANAVNIDNIQIDGNTISSTNTNGNIDLTPNGTGEVNITKVDIAGGEIDGTTIGANSAAAGTFTDFTASGTASFTSTGAVKVPVGTQAERPGSPVAGQLRFNDDTDEFEGYNGTAWASVGGSAISNDTTTATDLYPTFVDATTGTALELFTSNAQYLFKPSTGELKVKAPVASNGILVNATTMTSNYTIATGTNGLSVGPFTIDSGVTLTINSGQRHLIL